METAYKQHNLIENNILILSKQTMDLFLAQNDPASCIALYTFYYYTAKWQNTNQIKASINYTAKGIKWGEDKVRKYKKILIGLGLIEDVRNIDKETNKVLGWYIKLNYIWKRESHPSENTEGGQEATLGVLPPLAKSDPNALSVNSLNASAFSKENGDAPQSVKTIGALLKEKLQKIKSKPRSNKINHKFQAYAVEAADIAELKNGGRNRLFQLFKQKDYGYAQVEKTKEIVSNEIYKKFTTEDQKIRYLIGAYRRNL